MRRFVHALTAFLLVTFAALPAGHAEPPDATGNVIFAAVDSVSVRDGGSAEYIDIEGLVLGEDTPRALAFRFESPTREFVDRCQKQALPAGVK